MVQQSAKAPAALLIDYCHPTPLNGTTMTTAAGGMVHHSQSIIAGQQAQLDLPQADSIKLRAATPGDAKQLRALIQELADHHDMSDAPQIGAERLAADLKAGIMYSVVAMDEEEMAGYAIYYLPSSSAEGPILFLEDLYVRSKYRRNKLGIRLIVELAKIAHARRLRCIEWDVARTNIGAIKFYHKLPGLVDLTDGKDRKPAERKIMWRLPVEAFDHVLRKAEEQSSEMPGLEVEVLMDKPGQIDEHLAHRLARQWQQLMMTSDGRKQQQQQHLGTKALAKQLQNGQLGVIVVKNNSSSKQKIAAAQPIPCPVAMAFFHRKSYSTWTGQFVVLDQIIVHEQCKGIGTAMVAELVKIGKAMKAVRIQWTAAPSEQPGSKCQHIAFFESLNAINLTDAEGWLLYRWNYEQSGMHEKENDAADARC